jgi:hypothetical protein
MSISVAKNSRFPMPQRYAPFRMRKCGVELPRILTEIIGTQRRARWQRTRKVGRPDLSSFALMLADERLGRG